MSTPTAYAAIRFARTVADAAHREVGQVREGSGAPYITHCAGVAQHVRRAGGDLAQIQAAYLHDTLEDTNLTGGQIHVMFGPDVCALVRQVSQISTLNDGTRAQRTYIDLRHYARGSARAQTINLADILDNLKDISTLQPSFAKIYLREKADLVAALTLGDSTLRREAQLLIAQQCRTLNQGVDL
ncbi:HD domain-containing protein [Marinobacter shengliensis]|uniref:HD domain-containing protein n=1 Tax=Marinobacter shengliensis TaxID=1389223 RepID=UPI0014866BF6|nr:HD domain-containing protein [Marinobacter shengliensis]